MAMSTNWAVKTAFHHRGNKQLHLNEIFQTGFALSRLAYLRSAPMRLPLRNDRGRVAYSSYLKQGNYSAC